MFARTFAELLIVIAVSALGFLTVTRVAVPAIKAPRSGDTHQEPAPQVARRPTTGVIILGNIIMAVIYVLLYGFGAGAFN